MAAAEAVLLLLLLRAEGGRGGRRAAGVEVAGRESGDGGKEKGKEREGEVGIFFYYMWAPHKHILRGARWQKI